MNILIARGNGIHRIDRSWGMNYMSMAGNTKCEMLWEVAPRKKDKFTNNPITCKSCMNK